MPKLSPPVFGAHVDVDAAQHTRALSASLTRPSITTRARDVGGSSSRASSPSPRPATSSRSPGAARRAAGNASSSTGRPLRGSSKRPRKPIVPPSPGQPGSGSASANRRHVDPVGDHHRVAAEVLDHDLPGRRGHRDPAGELLQHGLQRAVGRRQHPRAGRRGVEGRDHRAVGERTREQRQARRGRLVHVQHVELALAQPAADPGRRERARTAAGPPSRCTGRARARPAGDHVGGQARPVPPRRAPARDTS